jgi:Luciferase-like monooxygenase
MRFAVNIPNFGDFADPRLVADLARRAEEAGWDGLFVWDHITHHKELRREIADPWVLLTAAALATSRIRLGTMITPVARRRVSKLAREVTTLDRLTGGRMILGVGLGAPLDDEYGSFGESTDPKLLAAKLDEGLFGLNELWSGDPVTFRGHHVVLDDVALHARLASGAPSRRRLPSSLRSCFRATPRPFGSPRSARARPCRSLFVQGVSAFLRGCREEAGRAAEPFDLIVSGSSTPETGADVTGPLAEAGATWWQECAWDENLERAKPMLRRVEAGPPR